MNSDIVLIVGEDRLHHYLGASAILAAIMAWVGWLGRSVAGDAAVTGSSAIAAAAAALTAYRGLRLHSRLKRAQERLVNLSRLLSEGVEAEPGRVVMEAGYTGERVPRGYARFVSFRPSGDPRIVVLDELREWRPRYTLIAVGDQGVLDAEAYMVKLEDVNAYITRLHGGVEVRVSRERLTTRHGREYAEALIEAEASIVSIIVSHVGRSTHALVELEVVAPLEATVRLLRVRGRSARVYLPLAPYTPTTLIIADTALPVDAARALGRRILVYGHGIEARIRLVLRRGPLSLDRDEAILKSMAVGG